MSGDSWTSPRGDPSSFYNIGGWAYENSYNDCDGNDVNNADLECTMIDLELNFVCKNDHNQHDFSWSFQAKSQSEAATREECCPFICPTISYH